MATWRLTVCFKTTITDQSGSKRVLDRTDSVDEQITTREEGLQKLPQFLESQRRVYGDHLRWVALEDTLSVAPWSDPDADWLEIGRLSPQQGFQERSDSRQSRLVGICTRLRAPSASHLALRRSG